MPHTSRIPEIPTSAFPTDNDLEVIQNEELAEAAARGPAWLGNWIRGAAIDKFWQDYAGPLDFSSLESYPSYRKYCDLVDVVPLSPQAWLEISDYLTRTQGAY